MAIQVRSVAAFPAILLLFSLALLVPRPGLTQECAEWPPLRVTSGTLPEVTGTFCAMDGDFCYTGGDLFHAVDISDPLQPRVASSLELEAPVVDGVHKGHWVFVTTESNTLFAIDVSDPTEPTISPIYSYPGGMSNVAWYQDMIVVVCEGTQVHFLEFDGSSQAELIAVFESDDPVMILGGARFLGLKRGWSVDLFDASDPSNLILVGHYQNGAMVRYILNDDYLIWRFFAYAMDYVSADKVACRAVTESGAFSYVQWSDDTPMASNFLGIWDGVIAMAGGGRLEFRSLTDFEILSRYPFSFPGSYSNPGEADYSDGVVCEVFSSTGFSSWVLDPSLMQDPLVELTNRRAIDIGRWGGNALYDDVWVEYSVTRESGSGFSDYYDTHTWRLTDVSSPLVPSLIGEVTRRDYHGDWGRDRDYSGEIIDQRWLVLSRADSSYPSNFHTFELIDIKSGELIASGNGWLKAVGKGKFWGLALNSTGWPIFSYDLSPTGELSNYQEFPDVDNFVASLTRPIHYGDGTLFLKSSEGYQAINISDPSTPQNMGLIPDQICGTRWSGLG